MEIKMERQRLKTLSTSGRKLKFSVSAFVLEFVHERNQMLFLCISSFTKRGVDNNTSKRFISWIKVAVVVVSEE